MNLLVSYTDSKNEYLEKRISHLAESYGGMRMDDFYFDNGAFTCLVMFPTQAQEMSFRKDLLIATNALNIPIEFGGAIQI